MAPVEAVPPAATAPACAPAFDRRIPPLLGRELLALTAEARYLRVVTAAGSDLIQLRPCVRWPSWRTYRGESRSGYATASPCR